VARAAIAVTALLLTACGSQRDATTRSFPAAAGTPPAGIGRPGAATPAIRVRSAWVKLEVPAGNGAFPFNRPHRLQLPVGWTATVWARYTGLRLMAWTPEHHLLASSPQNDDVVEFVPGANPATVPARHVVITGLRRAQGLAFDRVGGREVLYVAAANELDRYTWVDGRPTDRTVLVPDLPDTQPAQDDVHELKNVVVGRDHTIYVDIGSSSNASPRTSWHGTPRASVMAYRPDGRRLRVWATGVRNGDGLAFAPDGTLWTAVNERDQMPYPFHGPYGSAHDAYDQVMQAYVNEHPPDEVARLPPGRDLGWPYCDPDPDVQPGVPGGARNYGAMRFDVDPQTNAGSRQLNCAKLTPIERGLPAHSAPLGFHFLLGSALPQPWSQGAVVAAHGSWDRQPPRSPQVYWLPWEARARTLGPAITILTGLQNANGSRWGRTVDALPGPDGALYVSDDAANAIYRIVPTGGS